REAGVAPLGQWLVLPRAQRQRALESGSQVVDMPVGDRSPRPLAAHRRRVATVDDPYLVLVVADAELAVIGPLEVGVDPEELGVPTFRRVEVVGFQRALLHEPPTSQGSRTQRRGDPRRRGGPACGA